MKRHLIWIISGAAAIGVAVPAIAAVQPSATPDDNGIPGEVRGNCDEAEHANDPACLTVTVPAPSTPSTAAPTTVQATLPSNSTGGTVPSNTTVGTVPDNTTPGNTSASTVPSNSLPGDLSGPCDEAEHANDPRCTGAAPIGDDGSGDDSGRDDDSGHGGDDDSSGDGGSDDNSGHGGGDDDNSEHGSDDD